MSDFEPREWFVVFHRKTDRWWVKWLAWGQFSHVSAFAEVRRAGMWVFVDFLVSRVRVIVIPDEKVTGMLGHLSNLGPIIKMPPRPPIDDEFRPKPGLWCVPGTAHVLGLSTCALRPDALYRHCLANGGVIVTRDDDEPEGAGRPGIESPAGAGAG